MASKTTALAIFLTLNILFFTHTKACSYCRPGPRPRPPSTPGTFPPGTFPPGTFPPGTTPPGTFPPGTTPPGTFPPGTNPPGTTPPGTSPPGTCPRDALKLGVCVDLLGGLLNVTIGTPPTLPCCTLIQGLADLEAAVCLCTVIRASILGITLNIPVSLSLLLNVCGRNVPRGFQCA